MQSEHLLVFPLVFPIRYGRLTSIHMESKIRVCMQVVSGKGSTHHES